MTRPKAGTLPRFNDSCAHGGNGPSEAKPNLSGVSLTYGRVGHDHHDVGVGGEHVDESSEVGVAHFHALEGSS